MAKSSKGGGPDLFSYVNTDENSSYTDNGDSRNNARAGAGGPVPGEGAGFDLPEQSTAALLDSLWRNGHDPAASATARNQALVAYHKLADTERGRQENTDVRPELDGLLAALAGADSLAECIKGL